MRWGPPAGGWAAGSDGCAGWAAAAYRGPVRRAVLAAKAGAPAAAVALLLERCPTGLVPEAAEVTWVPGHPLRTIRAPDGGRALASALGEREGLAVRRMLDRSPIGRRQARRSPDERRANAHRLGLRVVGRPGRCVVIVDDVRTTGATLDQVAALLVAGGAQSVFAVTVAAAPSEID